MNKATARLTQQRLRAIGFPTVVDSRFGAKSRADLRQFKRGWTRWKRRLRDNSSLSPRTIAALRWSASHGGHCSEHFAYHQFACHNAEAEIMLVRELVQGLERMVAAGMPVQIIDGYRAPAYNRSIGGEPDSQHLWGAAADLAPQVSWQRVQALHVFSGIGYEGSNGLVRHVDVRGHAPGSPATTPGSPSAPTKWTY